MNRANAPPRFVLCEHYQLDARAVDLTALESSRRFTGRCRPGDITFLSDYQRRALSFRCTRERNVLG